MRQGSGVDPPRSRGVCLGWCDRACGALGLDLNKQSERYISRKAPFKGWYRSGERPMSKNYGASGTPAITRAFPGSPARPGVVSGFPVDFAIPDRIPCPSCPTITPPGLPVVRDLQTLESQEAIASKGPNSSNCDADTNNVTPGHQLTLDSYTGNFDSIRPRRTRKANILNLNACICGVTITEHEIQNGEGIMKCRVLGCETVWVSNDYLSSLAFLALLTVSSST